MAANLGERVGVVTSAADDADFAAALPGIQIHRAPAANTSTFENRYVEGGRIQYIRAVADPLDAASVPAAWRGARTALLAPLTNEVMPGVEAAFPGAQLAATPQGWFRRWDADGLVRREGWEAVVDRLAGLDAVILSEDDVLRDGATIELLRRRLPLLIVTRSSRGGTLYVEGQPTDYPAFAA